MPIYEVSATLWDVTLKFTVRGENLADAHSKEGGGFSIAYDEFKSETLQGSKMICHDDELNSLKLEYRRI